MSLRDLLNFLASDKQTSETEWLGWRIQPVAGGANGIVYHVTREAEDYAIKFTLRDDRQRAWREFQTLTALQQAGFDLAPRPVLLDTESYPHDVTVQTWLDGAVLNEPPSNDTDWEHLINHLASIHRFTPDHTSLQLPPAVTYSRSANECMERVRWQMRQLPEPSAELQGLFARLENTTFPDWPPPRLTLCRDDPNILNFVRGADKWRSVDWENSGWNDSAFEIGDMMIHPAYMSVTVDRWDWVIERYVQSVHDSAAEVRIRTYFQILSVWWVTRFARYQYQIPRGLDQRLVERPPDWQAETQRKYDHYLHLAQSLMND